MGRQRGQRSSGLRQAWLEEQKEGLKGDVLKAGERYDGRISNVTCADSNSASTEPSAEVIGSVSATYSGCCFAPGRPAAWQCDR